MSIIVTDTDRIEAVQAIVEGHEKCGWRLDRDERKSCECPEGRIDSCRARIDAIALAIATARKM